MSDIKDKASYCLGCKVKPCSIKGCPLGNDIPAFITKVKEENYEEAYTILSKTTVLPGVCGRICPHEKQCEGVCVRGIKSNPVSIGHIESFIFDKMIESKKNLKSIFEVKEKTNKKVAVVGGGPSGLTCSAFLAKEGVDVTIYEKYNYLGGLLVHGIPEFRLSNEIIEETANRILELGVNVKYGMELGKNLNLEDLEKEYDAIFLGIGANISQKLGVEGEELLGVYGGNELLEHKLVTDFEGKTVIVNGGGNVAMDCARVIKKQGAKDVFVTYRRSRDEMPAEKKEIEEAIEEGVTFLFQNNIVKIVGDEKVEKIELIKTELIQKEGDTRLSPVNIENSNYEIDADYVVMALGSKTDKVVKTLGINLNKWSCIEIDDNYETSRKNIFAGGDLAGTKGTVAWAARSGREAARKIVEKI